MLPSAAIPCDLPVYRCGCYHPLPQSWPTSPLAPSSLCALLQENTDTNTTLHSSQRGQRKGTKIVPRSASALAECEATPVYAHRYFVRALRDLQWIALSSIFVCNVLELTPLFGFSCVYVFIFSVSFHNMNYTWYLVGLYCDEIVALILIQREYDPFCPSHSVLFKFLAVCLH